MKIEYFVFSGTGNTLLIAREIGGRLREKGHEVNYYRMDGINSFRMTGESVIGLAFPIAYFSSYPLVLRFIASLPEGRGRQIFMTSTMAGSSLGAERKFRRLVEAKGYKPIGCGLFLMPGNYNNPTLPVDKNRERVALSLKKAAEFADMLDGGKAAWGGGMPLIPSMWHSLVTSGRIVRFFYRMFPLEVDKAACIKCMRCVEICPTRAISSAAGDTPRINGALCESCQRCAAFCPVHAIKVPKKPAEQYRAVEYEDFRL